MNKNFVHKRLTFWQDSLHEVKQVKSICIAAMMMALNTLLGYFKIIVIPKLLTISFASLAIASCAMCCGPLLSAAMAGAADIIKYLVRPDGPFFIGFTLNECLTAMIYGCLFYRQSSISLKRCIAARLLVAVLINLLLTPLWLYMLYGDSFWAMLSVRITKNLLMFPIDTALLYLVLKTTGKVMAQMRIHNHK